MAQKREKEETELKVTEPLIRRSPVPTLSGTDDSASSNSDLPVDRSTSIILSSHQADGSDNNRSAQRSDPPPPDTTNLDVYEARSRPSSSSSSSSSSERQFLQQHQPASESDRRLFSSAAMAEMKRREVNRCAGCRRKVGLTGFRCRCGEMFCPEHRYSDRHDCSFDYKAAGREMIARENPVVRASKILKV